MFTTAALMIRTNRCRTNASFIFALMSSAIYNQILGASAKGKKQFAILIDPDKLSKTQLLNTIQLAVENRVDYFFVGGSLLLNNQLNEFVALIKESCNIPVILFPGSNTQICDKADAIFFLSLISGRNADLLIGQHVIAAPNLRASNLEVISTGYMLVNGGVPTAVSYMSNTTPIPNDKNNIAACTAMAGEMLGMKLIYMDAGSGARQCITPDMINAVRKNISLPIVVGGGITSAEKAIEACNAGADIIVVGNAIEKDATLISSIADAIKNVAQVS